MIKPVVEMEDFEYTLDPKNWVSFKKLGHEMLNDIFTYIEKIREYPVWQPPPEHFPNKELPMQGQSQREVYDEFKEYIFPYPLGSISPRFWGWVEGSGSPIGVLAEMLAAGMNTNSGGRNHAGMHVELLILNWSKKIMGFPATASGVLTSGCSEANLIGLIVARNVKAGWDVRKQGLPARSKSLTVYGSNQTHSSLQKAVEIIGIGNENFRNVPVNSNYSINCEKLEQFIEQDLKNGFKPICIVGNVGTVNTGAVDDLVKLREICDKYNLWFHLDGAFGAVIKFSKINHNLVAGIELGDSLAFDFHKWLHVPHGAGCILVKNKAAQRESFLVRPAYIQEKGKGLASGDFWPTDYGIALSRPFTALKIWFMLKETGIEKFGYLIDQNINQAKFLEKLLQEIQQFQILTPVTMNILCFRYYSKLYSDNELNKINEEFLIQIQLSGKFVPSSTVIDGKSYIRVAITNHRSRFEDFKAFVKFLTKKLKTSLNKIPSS